MKLKPTRSRHITVANAASAGRPTETIHGTCSAVRGAGDAFDAVRPADHLAEVVGRDSAVPTASESLRSRPIQFGPSALCATTTRL